MTGEYAYWASKLAGGDPDPPADRTILPCGFWRLRDGRPLAVWVNDLDRVALRGWAGADEFLPPHAMEAIAERGGFGTAITEDFYREAIRKGYWPDSEGPARDLMNSMRAAAEVFAAVAEQIADKLALYPDYRLTKKLHTEIIKAVASAGGAINAYDKEDTNVERRDAAA
jgi:hypothetical protein